MRALIQRVRSAQVHVEDALVGECGAGLLVLICAMQGDTAAQGDKLAAKIAKCRIFRDEDGRMNRSVLDVGGSALVVSQFTLAGDVRSGNRPGFASAAPPDEGRALYEHFASQLRDHGLPVQTGQFGADMAVSLINDGPVTIWMDTDQM